VSDKNLLFRNYLVHALLLILLTSLQTSFWMMWLGSLPPPYFWMPTVVYFFIYRSLRESTGIFYFAAIVIAAQSVAPTGITLLSMAMVYLFNDGLKRRFYWPSISYFVFAVGASAFLFGPLSLLFSRFFDSRPVTYIPWFTYVLSPVMTSLSALILFPILTWIDENEGIERPTEFSVEG